MKASVIRSTLFFLILLMLPVGYSATRNRVTVELIEGDSYDSYGLYLRMGLDSLVGYTVFAQALEGYRSIGDHKKAILTLIDFSKPSTQERMYVLDMERERLLFVSHVAHGRNSGANYATAFSNRDGSYQSSLGFFLTENTYTGRNGYSLVLEGLEPGINDRAKARAIVIHGASYANPSVIAQQGRLGRSLGCPALPEALTRGIIDTIKGGSLLYIYADDPHYVAQSAILSSPSFAAL